MGSEENNTGGMCLVQKPNSLGKRCPAHANVGDGNGGEQDTHHHPKALLLHNPRKCTFLPTGIDKEHPECLILSSKFRPEVEPKFSYRKFKCYASYAAIIKYRDSFLLQHCHSS